jgi:hypothetical protein
MRKSTGIPVFVTATVIVGTLLAATLIAAGSVTEWMPGALATVGAIILAVVAVVGAFLIWHDLVRSRSRAQAGWAVARTLLTAGFLLGMWWALTAPDPWFYLLWLFGALVALALTFLFALAKSPAAAARSSATDAPRAVDPAI